MSPSLLPIPGKVIDKVWAGLFVDLREMFPDNAALTKQITDTGSSAGSKLRELEDPLTWAFYFLAFLAVSVNDRKAKELAAYSQIVIQLAQRHGGRGWLGCSVSKLLRDQMLLDCPLTNGCYCNGRGTIKGQLLPIVQWSNVSLCSATLLLSVR